MEPVEIRESAPNQYDKSWAVTGTDMKRKHNIVNSLSLDPYELETFNFERYERYRKIEETETMAEEYMMDDAEICVAAFGIAAFGGLLQFGPGLEQTDRVGEAAREAGAYQRKLNNDNMMKIVGDVKKAGMQVVETIDSTPFLEATKPGRKTFTDKFGGDNYIKEIDAVRNAK